VTGVRALELEVPRVRGALPRRALRALPALGEDPGADADGDDRTRRSRPGK